MLCGRDRDVCRERVESRVLRAELEFEKRDRGRGRAVASDAEGGSLLDSSGDVGVAGE